MFDGWAIPWQWYVMYDVIHDVYICMMRCRLYVWWMMRGVVHVWCAHGVMYDVSHMHATYGVCMMYNVMQDACMMDAYNAWCMLWCMMYAWCDTWRMMWYMCIYVIYDACMVYGVMYDVHMWCMMYVYCMHVIQDVMNDVDVCVIYAWCMMYAWDIWYMYDVMYDV